jgi:hypothetical protein
LKVLREFLSEETVNWKNMRGGKDETLPKMPIAEDVLALGEDSSL